MRWALLLVVCLPVFLVVCIWIDHNLATTLPAPTGPFAVGRVIDFRTDRPLLVWIWYPAGASSAAPDDYIPQPYRSAIASTRGPVMGNLLTRDLSKVHGHAVRNAPISPRRKAYPFLILRGGAAAEVVNYSTIAEDLASHGYVVAGFDAPYRTNVVLFPDGRIARRTRENNPEMCLSVSGDDRERCVGKIIDAWTSDIRFALDRIPTLPKFAGHIDTARVGVFGHSLGGATALQFCHDDARCKAGIDIDGSPHGRAVRDGVRQPFMFLLSDHSGENDADSRKILADIQSIYDRLPPGARSYVTIPGANHFFFSDDLALLKSHVVIGILRAIGLLHIDGRRQLAMTNEYVRTFFDAHLK
jgi:predicted dienelactone hydrolase